MSAKKKKQGAGCYFVVLKDQQKSQPRGQEKQSLVLKMEQFIRIKLQLTFVVMRFWVCWGGFVF